MPGVTDTHRSSVIEYYVSTKREYRFLWRSNKSLGIHFGYYDEEHRTHDAAILNINRKLAELAGITSKDKVLDAGCGIGGTSLWLAANHGCHVTGINIVPWQIDSAKSMAKERKLDRLTDFKLADFADTRLKSTTYDLMFGLESIVHAEDKQAVIDEAFRLLKPGGRLVIIEYLLTQNKLLPEDQKLIDRWLKGWAMPSLLTEKQYRSMAKKAGFSKITFHDWTESVRPSLDRLKRFIRIFYPVAPLLTKLHLINEGQLGNIDASDAQMESLEKNIWQYKVLVAQKSGKTVKS